MSRTSPVTLPQPLAYLNGQWLPVREAAVSVFDGGFIQGVTVAEQLRTFGGKLFQLDRHLDRLARSLEIVGVDPGLAREDFAQIAGELAARNHSLLNPADDLGLTMFVTPGPYGSYVDVAPRNGPVVCIHTQPLPFLTWAQKYERGDSLVVSSVMQVPTACWPSELKCRSRMHYFLADKEARQLDPGARALLLDERGYVIEASTANILVYYQDVGLVSPPRERILPGVTVSVVEELARQERLPFTHRDLTPDDVAAADEVLLCSTSPCIWPVSRLNKQPIGDGRPGPISQRLRAAWNRLVGLDIAAQAVRFSTRP